MVQIACHGLINCRPVSGEMFEKRQRVVNWGDFNDAFLVGNLAHS